MSDKINELENIVETVEEVTEEASELINEASEEVDEACGSVEEAIEQNSENIENADITDESDEDYQENGEDEQPQIPPEFSAEEPIQPEVVKKKSVAPAIIAIVVVVALIVAVLFAIFGKKSSGNKYNDMGYPAISGMTIEDISEQMGIGVSEFLTMYNLPADMPADTSQEAAFYSIPLSTFAEMQGIDIETLKTELNIPQETTVIEPKTFMEKIKRIFNPVKPEPITDDTPWGVVLDEITLGSYVGEENLEDFKSFYDLSDDITVDTKYKEVKDAINAKTLEKLKEQNASAEAQADDSAVTEEGVSEETATEEAFTEETTETEEAVAEENAE